MSGRPRDFSQSLMIYRRDHVDKCLVGDDSCELIETELTFRSPKLF